MLIDSLVTDLSDGSVVQRAKKGEDNVSTSGGAGYCGGGGGLPAGQRGAATGRTGEPGTAAEGIRLRL